MFPYSSHSGIWRIRNTDPKFLNLNTKYITSSSKHNKIYCTVLYNMLHNYMFRPFFRPSSGCIRLALRLMYPDDKYITLMIKVENLLSGYINLKAKRIQPEDGLKKGRNM